jgi:hypothetical protein
MRALILLLLVPTVAHADTLVYVPIPQRAGYATVFTPSGQARYVPNSVVPQARNGLTPVIDSTGIRGYVPTGLIPHRAGMQPVIMPGYRTLPATTSHAQAGYGAPANLVVQGFAGGSTGITIPMPTGTDPHSVHRRNIAKLLCP